MPTLSFLRPSGRLRLAIQAALTIFCLYAGYLFYRHVLWLGGETEIFTPKPPSVEAFLPISALMAAKRFFLTGQWDSVHPAGLTLFLAFLLMTVALRKGFCGYICPVGFISSMMERLGRKLKTGRETGPLATRLFTIPKYVILCGFLWFIVIGMDVRSIESFLSARYNLVADASMLHFFLSPSLTTILVVAALLVLSLFIRNAWCRFLCPYGALLGLFAIFSPIAVNREKDTCIACGKCRKACPSGIRVDEKQRVNSPECIGCAACLEACPVEGCLTMRAGSKAIPFKAVGISCVALLLAVYAWALATGHWTSEIPADMLRRVYMMQFGQ